MGTDDTSCFTGQDNLVSCHTCNDIVEEYDKKGWRFNTDGWQVDSIAKGLVPLCKQVFTNLTRPGGVSCRDNSHCAGGNCENNVCKDTGSRAPPRQQPPPPRQQPPLPRQQPPPPRQQMPLPYPLAPQITRPEMPQAPAVVPTQTNEVHTQPPNTYEPKPQSPNIPTNYGPDEQSDPSWWSFSWSKLTMSIVCLLVILIAVFMYIRWRKNNY